MRFGYFELGYQDAQRVLQPAYVMLLTLFSQDERIRMKSVARRAGSDERGRQVHAASEEGRQAAAAAVRPRADDRPLRR